MKHGGDCVYELAEKLEITISYKALRKYDGLWMPELNTIFIRRSLHHVHERSVIAHELGHVHHGHTHSDNPKYERQAEKFAAKLLICPKKLFQLCKTYADPQQWAFELGVTPEVLNTYLKQQEQNNG